MDFHLLGPLEVLDEGRSVALGGSKQRALLALLLLHANEPLSTDRLLADLWGEHPPATAGKTVQVHVSRLRKALASEDGSAGSVVTRDHGYVLTVDPEHIDAFRFERLVGLARSELAAERPAAAAEALDEALALWRGRPLADLADEPFAQAEIARLDDVRAAAVEHLVDARLALGRPAEVVGMLEALVAEHPYRERPRGQLMLALYRCDRQAEALQAYQDARRTLVEELGIEPGERLRDLERRILAQDPALASPGPAEPSEPPSGPELELPSGVLTFLLTDVEGSTGLWEADPAAMAAALEQHDDLIERTAGEHGGRLLKTKGEGDSTFTVFPRASDAVAAALAFQGALAATAWPGGLDLRVRVAVHTGEAHERAGDYFGPALNRAARMRSLARGGATVLSQATAEIVHDRLPPGAELADLGSPELRGLTRSEHLFELRDVTRLREATATVRKTVTVLFAGVVDAGPAARTLDPEARQRLTARLVEEMSEIAGRHGGSVETYPGEALLAVFGVPALHEDDALRAVRAAAEVRELVATEQAFGVRVGVATGEVITRPGGVLGSGGSVNAAKLLEEHAGPGQILVDAGTLRLVRALVEGEQVDEALSAFRLDEVRAGTAGRATRLDAPLVGRDRQMQALSLLFTGAVADRTCQLVTVLGVAGVGKSRLVDEFLGGLDDGPLVLRGRCLPYGEGITYWPLAEVIRDLTEGADDALAALAPLLEAEPKRELILEGLAEAHGLGGGQGGTPEKISWAVRRLLEAVAQRRPLIVVLDDLQWAEPTFLDLVEHVTALSHEAPITLLCSARPELVDVRPGWGGGHLNATSILLEPLSADESVRLTEHLLSRATLPGAAAQRVAEVSEGNPLFAEELVAMLVDEGLDDMGELPVPPTIHALIAARLERLPEHERAMLARASVEGTVFHRDALHALVPAATASDVDRGLAELVRRDVIRPDRSAFADDDAFRFRHMLIRDAAYRSLPKETRARLHQRFAVWLEAAAAPRAGEFEEITGYHLEQAYRFLAELDAADAELGAVAAQRLASAGRRARARSDRMAAIGLLERAAALIPEDDAGRARLLPVLGAALLDVGRLTEADDVLAQAAKAAQASADEGAAAHTAVQRQFVRLQRGEPGGTAEAGAVVERALPIFTEAEDEQGLCAALRLRAWQHWIQAGAEAAADAWEQAAVHAERAGAEHERIEILAWIGSTLFFGPTPVPEAIHRCEAIRGDVGGNLEAVACVLEPLAGLHAMEGRFDHARELLAARDAAFAELGLTLNSAVSHHAAIVELLAGDAAAAERSLRSGYAQLEEMGDRALLSTTAAILGQALVAQGRDEEAQRYAEVSAGLAAGDDAITEALWRGVRARCLAARGEVAEGADLARRAVSLLESTDFVNHRADALLDLAVVLGQAGRPDDAHEAAAQALRLFQLKGNAVAAERAKAHLAVIPGI